MYQQLSDNEKSDAEQIKALQTVFTTDSFMVLKQLTAQHLHPGKSVDIFLDLEVLTYFCCRTVRSYQRHTASLIMDRQDDY